MSNAGNTGNFNFLDQMSPDERRGFAVQLRDFSRSTEQFASALEKDNNSLSALIYMTSWLFALAAIAAKMDQLATPKPTVEVPSGETSVVNEDWPNTLS